MLIETACQILIEIFDGPQPVQHGRRGRTMSREDRYRQRVQTTMGTDDEQKLRAQTTSTDDEYRRLVQAA